MINMRLIDGDELLTAFPVDDEPTLTKSCVRTTIKHMPTIEPERKRGKWIYNSPVTMKCNQCGLVIKDWDWHRFKYCPNCCADMRDENDDTPDDIPIEYFESGGK